MGQSTMTETYINKPVFIDTGAFIALLLESDSNHKAAKEVWNKMLSLECRLITTNFIISETYTWLRYKVSHYYAMRFIEIVEKSNDICALEIIYSDSEVEKGARCILEKYNDQTFSYTDSVSFTVMKSNNINDAFTFDNHFSIMTFNVISS